MKSIYFLHGNPGHPSDWNSLISHLPQNIKVHTVDTHQIQWISQIQNEKEKVLVVAHSWGCFRLLSQVKKLSHKIERVFLINPYLIAEKPTSVVQKAVLSLPIVGSSLVKAHHKKSYAQFLNDMIHPEVVQSNSFYSTKLQMLSDSESWFQAIKGRSLHKQKLENAHHPILGFSYFGEQDKIQNNNIQKSELKKFQYLQIKNFQDGGHGLLWSHAKAIAEDIKPFIERIGYISGTSEKNNVISFMQKHVLERGDQIALMWASSVTPQLTHQSITFRALEDRIARFAQGLLDIGIQKGDRVIIFLPMSVDMYISMFAVQRIGAIAVFLDSWARSHHLGASAECVQPKAMISFNQAFQLVNQVPEFNSMPIRILYGPGEGATHQYQNLFSQKRSHIEPVESEFTALITFTTGSTGKPKGANRTHRFLVAQHFALTHVIPYTATDLDMPAFPIFSLNSLATGVSTLLPAVNLAQPAPTDSALLTAQILKEKVTCTTLSPSMLVGVAKYCDENKIQLSRLRRVVTGGAPISQDDVKAFYKIAPQVELWILYGSTEAEPMAHIEGRDMIKQDIQSIDSDVIDNGVNVGEISEDIDYKFIRIVKGPIVLGPQGWSEFEVPVGEVGEFICTGDHVCREYYNNPDAFLSTKILDSENRVWHRTGDLAYQDKKKNLWIVGRVNNAIVKNDKLYFPVQAEILLKRFDFTERCAFLGLPIEGSDTEQLTCVAIQLKAGINLNSDEAQSLRLKVTEVFEKNQIPVDHVKFVEKIPMDPRHHSKVEYAVLRDSILKGEGVLFD